MISCTPCDLMSSLPCAVLCNWSITRDLLETHASLSQLRPTSCRGRMQTCAGGAGCPTSPHDLPDETSCTPGLFPWCQALNSATPPWQLVSLPWQTPGPCRAAGTCRLDRLASVPKQDGLPGYPRTARHGASPTARSASTLCSR
jgi:hypothetical protein